MDHSADITLTVNGEVITRRVPVRCNLVDFLRVDLALTGSHVGCEHGVCGACTIEIDGAPARACLTLAVQIDGASLRTVEALAPAPGRLSILQEAFRRHHALQCGFCTPGMIMTAVDMIRRIPHPDRTTIRAELEGNICRCTGYQNIVSAIEDAAVRMSEEAKGAAA